MFDRLNDKIDERTQIEAVQKKKHELHFIGNEALNRSHILFSYNTETHEVKRAEIDMCTTIDFNTQEQLYAPKVVVERNCIYRQALNDKNFRKILKREGYDL